MLRKQGTLVQQPAGIVELDLGLTEPFPVFRIRSFKISDPSEAKASHYRACICKLLWSPGIDCMRGGLTLLAGKWYLESEWQPVASKHWRRGIF